MSDVQGLQKAEPQTQSSESGHTLMTSRQPHVSEAISSKRVCFYKSGDAQFSGLPMVINNRTFRTFESLLDSLSKRVPLPFGVRTITTPRGLTAVRSLDQLENGRSYICSDRRTVKPVDLERARQKPRPWYHPRPVSARRRALQQVRRRRNPARSARSTRSTRSTRRAERTLLRSPKRLVVFRNGEPDEKRTVMLQRRTTYTFEALLNHVSEVMRFPVVKLCTLDGKRVDGLPALILCSGVLVAAGREPFRPGRYDAQKPPAPAWLPAKIMGRVSKRFRPAHRKKKSMSGSSKSRNFSPSSERYLVSQLHLSAAGSVYDLPCNPNGSVEMDTSQQLESVAETETLTCPEGVEEIETHMASDDDIEKSFRVNQDGSMTVEMKVRLTVKEEETVQWTTTLSRSSVANQIKAACDSEASLDVHSPDLIMPSKNSPVTMENKHNCDIEESSSTLGWHKVCQKQESVEATRAVTEPEVLESVVESHSYTEGTCSEERVQDHRVPQQCNSHPVPKPRSCFPIDTSKTSTLMQSSSFRSAEILEVQDSGEEVRETVLHIYEQQSCQENFFANTQLCVQGVTTYGSPPERPASSGKIRRSSSKDRESEARPSTAHLHFGRQEHFPLSSDPHVTSDKSNIPPALKSQTEVPSPAPVTVPLKEERTSATQSSSPSKTRKGFRVVVRKSYVLLSGTTERTQKGSRVVIPVETRRDVPRPLKQKTKAIRKLLKRRNKQNKTTVEGHGGTPVKETTRLKDSVHLNIERQNELSAVKRPSTKVKTPDVADSLNVKACESTSSLKKTLLETSPSKSVLTRQTSMHAEQDHERETCELTESVSLTAAYSSSSVINEYVGLWLQKSQPGPEGELDGEPPSNVGLQQNTLFHVGSEPGLSPEVSEITYEIGYAEKSLHNTLSAERTQQPRHPSCEKSIAPTHPAIDKIVLTRSSLAEKTLLATDETLEKTAKRDSSVEKGQEEMKHLSRNVSLKRYLTAVNQTENNSLATDKSLEKPLPVKALWKNIPSHEETSSERPQLKSQPSVEIPKHNTLAKASLFNNQSAEIESDLHRKATIVRKQPPASLIIAPVSTDTSCEGMHECPSALMKQIVKAQSESLQELASEAEKTHLNYKDTQTMPLAEIPELLPDSTYTIAAASQPDLRPVLDQLCHSIQSLREITQRKRLSCLEKSNSLPDFSSHVASTFGSSSRVLLAFLSVMTLKDGLAALNTNQQVESRMSCSEALRMMKSLEELAAIENEEQLRASLNHLQRNTSIQLLQSWTGFQELSFRARSQSITPDSACSETQCEASQEEEQAIQGLMGQLGVPDSVREELAALSSAKEERMRCGQTEGPEEERESPSEIIEDDLTGLLPREDTVSPPDSMLDEEVNVQCHDTSDYNDSLPTSEAQDRQYEVMQEICEGTPFSVPIPEEESTGMRMEERLETEHETETLTDKETDGERMKEKATFHAEMYPKEEDRVVAEHTKSLVSNEDKLATSEEYKSSFEDEEDSCGEELSFEDGVCDMDEGLNQQDPECNYSHSQGSFILQKRAKEEIEEKCTPDQTSHAEGELRNKTQVVEMQKGSTENINSVSESEYEDTATRITGTLTNSVAELISSPEDQTRSVETKASYSTEKPCSNLTVHSEAQDISENDDLTTVSNISNEQAKIEEFMMGCTEPKARDCKDKVVHSTQASHLAPSEMPKGIRTTESSVEAITSDPVSSSLAFSYDSRGHPVVQEPKGSPQINRVKSIREMFLAKSDANTQSRHKQLPSPNPALSGHQPEHSSTDSGRLQLQSSPEILSREDSSSTLAIAKGYVRRTIERLYGRDNTNGMDRPPSAHKTKQRECPGKSFVSGLASFHEARTRMIADLSYFNATSSFDAYNEPSRCVTLSSTVETKDAVHTEKDSWLHRQNQEIGKSSEDFMETPRKEKSTLSSKVVEEDEKEDAPYSLFNSASPHSTLSSSEQDEQPGSKFTYFNMPNATDSELEQEPQSDNASKKKREVKVTPIPDSSKEWAEKNGNLPAFVPKDNKVHPLVEGNTTVTPVVTQPTAAQGPKTEVKRRPPTEPDAIEMLYVLCGQHCPIL